MVSTSEILRSKRLYQRQLPLFLVSAVSAFVVLEYFVGYKGSPVTAVKDELLLWASTMTYPISLFAYTTMVLGAAHRMRERTKPGASYRGAVYFGSLVFFGALCLSSPALLNGELFASIMAFTATFVGNFINITIIPMMIVVTLRMFMNTRSLDGFAFMVVFLAVYILERTTIFTVLWPDARIIGKWIDDIPVAGSQTGIIMVAAVSAIILDLRALVGKEPGTVELEVA